MVKNTENEKESKKVKPLHIQEIPKKYFPRKGKSKEYALKLMRTIADLNYINKKIQYSAQICVFNIKSLTQKSGFKPKSSDVFDEIKEFVYHYENYCFRLYVFREKLIQFINAVIPLGYTDKEVRIRDIIISPLVREIGILPIIEQFSKNTHLSRAIEDRTKMTHRIYYGQEFDHYLRPNDKVLPKKSEDIKKWFDEWRRQIVSRSMVASKCRDSLDITNHELAQKIVEYKQRA